MLLVACTSSCSSKGDSDASQLPDDLFMEDNEDGDEDMED